MAWYCNLYVVVNERYYKLGTKNVAKQVMKISQGTVKDRGRTWFPEIVDKRKCICMCSLK